MQKSSCSTVQEPDHLLLPMAMVGVSNMVGGTLTGPDTKHLTSPEAMEMLSKIYGHYNPFPWPFIPVSTYQVHLLPTTSHSTSGTRFTRPGSAYNVLTDQCTYKDLQSLLEECFFPRIIQQTLLCFSAFYLTTP